MKLIAGVDEVGRGPLAGPVVAAAVILDPNNPINGLVDSKKLTGKKREALVGIIKSNCIAWSIASASVEEIDEINILQASLLAMERAILALNVIPEHVQVDGNFLPKISCTGESIISGDNLIPAISAASIIAKIYRDQKMINYDDIYPEYGFRKHKGYGTKQHLLAIQAHGITSLHRRSFRPIRKYLVD